MKSYQTIVPQNFNAPADNPDQPIAERMVPEDVLGKIEGYFFDLFGGVTIGPESTGLWRDDDGTVYRDIVRTYTVFSADRDTVHMAANRIGLILDQVSMAIIEPDGTADLRTVVG